MSEGIGYEVKMNEPYESAIDKVVAALKDEGFGVLTKIDVKTTLKEKLDTDFRPYVILGACNPPLAHRALSLDPAVGLMLPCNVTVEENSEGGATVRIVNPEMMMMVGALEENSGMKEVAMQARAKLENVAFNLKQ